jgi:DNA-binding transcriptional LysR family regulator
VIEELRARRLDAVITSLPAPTSGLRTTLLGEQRAVAVLPALHPLAIDSAVTLERLAPERVVVLAREANPAFHDAVIAMCRTAGLAPALVEIQEPRVEHALLAVAAGAGIALLPESVTERYASPGTRFVALEGCEPAFQTAVLTHADVESLATLSFVRALTGAARSATVDASRPAAAWAA